jgi:hypothetical protein
MVEPDFWKAGGQELSAKVDELLESCGSATPVPETLFHFTDCTGLSGILTTKVLWASLATSLNDASETKYAIARLCARLKETTIRPKHIPGELLWNFLQRRVQIEGLISDSRAYVVSFCGGVDEAIHWLHYGRSGTGAAIGFEAAGLKAEQFSLCPVIYDPARQDELLISLVTLVDEFAGAFADKIASVRFPNANDRRASLDAAACHLLTMYLRLMSPRLKDPAFKAEHEWRLITNEAWTPREGIPTRETHFRSTGGRVVPFKEIKFETLPVTEIVLGSSSPMQDDEQAIAVLMENTLGKTFPVRRSTVAVRP